MLIYFRLDPDSDSSLPNSRPSPSSINMPFSKEKLAPTWERMIDAALDVFAPVKQTNSNMLDAFYTEKGHKYLLALMSIQQIIKRICQSCRVCPNVVDPSLISKCEILVAIWDNLVDLIDTDRLPLQEPIEMEQTDYLCNICGTNLSVNNTHFDTITELSYHSNCANFWLNKVANDLPQGS